MHRHACAPSSGTGRLSRNKSLHGFQFRGGAVHPYASLRLVGAVVFYGFLLPDPEGPDADKELLPSLRWLYLEDVEMEDRDWDHLVHYLTHQTSGNRSISLGVIGEGVHICTDVLEQIGDFVEDFVYLPDLDKECPFDNC